MRIEKIFIRDLKRSFETKLDTNDNIIYVVDNELLSNGCYKNGFLNNMLIWCQEDKSVKRKELEVRCDVSVLDNDKYTIQIKSEQEEEEVANGNKYVDTFERRIFTFLTETHDKNKLNYGKNYIKEVFACCLDAETLVFDQDNLLDFDSYLCDSFLSNDIWTKDATKIAREYTKERLLTELSNGDKLIVNLFLGAYEESELQVIDKNGNECDEESSLYIDLIKFIVVNGIIKNVKSKLNKVVYPIFISDTYLNNLPVEQIKVITDLIKSLELQAFIISRKPNKQLECYCDKTIKYYYNTKNKTSEIPF